MPQQLARAVLGARKGNAAHSTVYRIPNSREGTQPIAQPLGIYARWHVSGTSHGPH